MIIVWLSLIAIKQMRIEIVFFPLMQDTVAMSVTSVQKTAIMIVMATDIVSGPLFLAHP